MTPGFEATNQSPGWLPKKETTAFGGFTPQEFLLESCRIPIQSPFDWSMNLALESP